MSSTPDQRIRWTAYHEAGHAVAAAIQGFSFRSGGIYADSNGHGNTEFIKTPARCSKPFSATEEKQKRTLVVLFAGLVAQKRWWPSSPDKYGDCDEEEVEQYLSAIYRTEPEREIARSFFKNEAIRLVSIWAHLVENVASRLLAQQSKAASGVGGDRVVLSGSEIVSILEREIPLACVNDDLDPEETFRAKD